jgi:DNA-binding beta-propeller fold protein YncE
MIIGRGTRLLLVLLALGLTACATERPRGTLIYGMDASAEGKRVVFPPDPEVPRYVYAGQLVGEQNFIFEKPKRSAVVEFLAAIAGIDSAPDQPLELTRPQGIAGDAAGRVYVTDVGEPRVVAFDPVDGRLNVFDRAVGFTKFVAPTGITVTPEGDILVADSELALVARLKPDGTTLEPIGRGLLQRPAGIAYDPAQKRIIVADVAAHDLKVFDLDGRLLATIGRQGEAPGEFNRPTYVTIWQNEVYVADTFNARVQVLDLVSGEPLRTIGSRGLFVGDLVRPKGVAVDSEGNVYVVESYYDHLLVYDRQGQLLLGIGGSGYGTGKFYLPAGLWVDDKNRVYLADMFNGRVVTYLFLGGDGGGT